MQDLESGIDEVLKKREAKPFFKIQLQKPQTNDPEVLEKVYEKDLENMRKELCLVNPQKQPNTVNTVNTVHTAPTVHAAPTVNTVHTVPSAPKKHTASPGVQKLIEREQADSHITHSKSKKIKCTFYLTQECLNEFNTVYAKRIIEGEKVDKGTLFHEMVFSYSHR